MVNSEEFQNPVLEDENPVQGDTTPIQQGNSTGSNSTINRAKDALFNGIKDTSGEIAKDFTHKNLGSAAAAAATEFGMTAIDVAAESTPGLGAIMRRHKMKSIDDKFDKIFGILSHLQRHIAKTDKELKVKEDDLLDDRAIKDEIEELKTLNEEGKMEDTAIAMLEPEYRQLAEQNAKERTSPAASPIQKPNPTFDVEVAGQPKNRSFFRRKKSGGGKKTKKKKKKTKKRKSKKSKKTKKKKK